jgi:prepilin-type N-terminal cleavage/methylation domain-containing protein
VRPGAQRDGFTLTELMVVLVILAIGILPLAMVQSRARQEVSESNRYTQAITVAQDQLERMKGLGFNNAAPDSGVVGAITWRANVVAVSLGLERLQVTVSWTDIDGPQSLTVADLVSMR